MTFFTGKTVLVTGGGGTIGGELVRQLRQTEVANVIAFDSSEIALYKLEREYAGRDRFVTVLGDVSDTTDVTSVFHDYPIDTVFHAAAYKHVGLCERNKAAAWRVNSYGTQKLVVASRPGRVTTFVLISTDKAVRPTCVMGKTKEDAEGIVLNAGYTVVRLGNVWASSGSVIPLWERQIAANEPVTITDGRATRYFIGLEEAGGRILQAAEIARGGEVFVPDMGSPKKIFDLAQELGAKRFNFVGLQPGEKVHEELAVGELVDSEHPCLYRDTLAA